MTVSPFRGRLVFSTHKEVGITMTGRQMKILGNWFIASGLVIILLVFKYVFEAFGIFGF